ncbi:MAG: GNAT family N-acetyltransferase [Halapricum sp.]
MKQAAISELATHTYTPAEPDAWAPDDDALEEYRAATSADAFQVLVAEDGARIVGYAVLNATDARIEALFVRPFWTRTGIGTRLLSQLETSATFADCQQLPVVSSLNAVPFYESLGYDRVGDRARTIDGVEIGFTLLEKDLTAEESAVEQ